MKAEWNKMESNRFKSVSRNWMQMFRNRNAKAMQKERAFHAERLIYVMEFKVVTIEQM